VVKAWSSGGGSSVSAEGCDHFSSKWCRNLCIILSCMQIVPDQK